jgi:hypothetical protein
MSNETPTASAVRLPSHVLAAKATARAEGFLSSPNLDPEWIQGWQAAVKKVAAAIGRIKDDTSGDVACPVSTANVYYDAYPVGSTRAFAAGWNSATNDIAHTLRAYADNSDHTA